MKVLKDIGLFTFRYMKLTMRNPVFLIMGVMVPLTYLTLFSPLLKNLMGNVDGNILNLFVPGMLPLIAFSTGIFAGFGIIDELRSGIIERFRVTPASRFSILAGPVLHDVLATIFQSILFVLIALPFGFRPQVLGLCLLFPLLVLLVSITSAFGNAIGVIVKSEDKYAPIVHGINLPVLLLSGVLVPISFAPTWLKVIAHCNPLYYVVEAARSLAMGHICTLSVLHAFLILIPFTCFTLYWATGVFRKAIA